MTQQVLPIRGMPQAIRQFRELSQKVQRDVLRKAIRSAARIVVKDARNRVPVDTGALRKAVGSSVKIGGNGLFAVASVGVRRRQKGAPARRAHLIEFGSQHNAAHPFLRPALVSQKDQVAKQFSEQVQVQIGKQVAKRVKVV